jgi:hypothetical protein
VTENYKIGRTEKNGKGFIRRLPALMETSVEDDNTKSEVLMVTM